MNLSNLLSRLGGFDAMAREGVSASSLPSEGASTRVGGVVIAKGVANDMAAPANDRGRPHILAQRAARRERREIRSA